MEDSSSDEARVRDGRPIGVAQVTTKPTFRPVLHTEEETAHSNDAIISLAPSLDEDAGSIDDSIEESVDDIYIEDPTTTKRTASKVLVDIIDRPVVGAKIHNNNHRATMDAPFDEGVRNSGGRPEEATTGPSFVEVRQEPTGPISYSTTTPPPDDVNEETKHHVLSNSSDLQIMDEEVGRQELLLYKLTAVSTESIEEEPTSPKLSRTNRFTWRVLLISALLLLLSLLVVTIPTVLWSKQNKAKESKAVQTSLPPCTTDCPFATTAELYRAVDLYFAYELSANLTDAELTNTSVALRYGYPMNRWNVSRLHDFSEVFRAGARTKGPVLSPDTKVIVERRVLEEDISAWDVSNARRMDYMFFGVTTTEDWSLKTWNVGSVTNFSYMFGSWTGQQDVGLGNWDVKSGQQMDYMFAGSSSDDPIDFRQWNTGNVRSMEGMFAQSYNVVGEGLQVWDVSKVQNMNGMFYVESPPRIGLLRDQSYSVYSGPSFASDLSGWEVSSLRSANQMFYGNLNYHQSLCWWTRWLRDDVSTNDMFYGTNCASLDDPDNTGYCTLCEFCNLKECPVYQQEGTRLFHVGLDRCLTTNYRLHFEGERVIGSKCSNDGFTRRWFLPDEGVADRIFSPASVDASGASHDICLETWGPSSEPGTPIQVSRCSVEVHSTYRWTIRATGQIEQAFVADDKKKASGTGMCVTSAVSSLSFELRPCADPASLDQMFTFASPRPVSPTNEDGKPL